MKLVEKYLTENNNNSINASIEMDKAIKDLEIAFKRLTMRKNEMVKKYSALSKAKKVNYAHVGDLKRVKIDIDEILEYI